MSDTHTQANSPQDDDIDATVDALDAASVNAAEIDEPPVMSADSTSPAAQIAALQKQLAEMQDKMLRQRAEFENVRRRMQREMTDARTFAKIAAIEEFLPAYDTFSLAMTSIDTATDMTVLKQGMSMIANGFRQALENLGIERISSVGKPFDPHTHEAVSTEASATVPENHVLREWKPAYKLGDKLLRAAVVVVSSGPAVAEEVIDDEDDTTES